ncbi:hypothetical protein PGQ11_011973 [Apiospora arundinis]|uniref:Uncharacterized protein n=1 Tax=Apiospora arundinis TaxID=335852 RepID=A0ABR2I128_9PEZI
MMPRLRVSGAKPATIPEHDETEILGSETGILRDPLDFNHAAVVFADALFRKLPFDLDVAAFDRMSPELEQTIRNFSYTVTSDGRDDAATSATARRLGTKIRRHPK